MTLKIRKILLLTFFILTIFIGGFSFIESFAMTEEEKYWSEVSINDSFMDDELIVVLNNTNSKNYKKYKIKDFKEINCIDVVDLTNSYQKLNKQKKVGNIKLEDRDSFRRILKLKLGYKSKYYVLECMKTLMQRDDVICVEPNLYIESETCSVVNDYYYNNNYNNNNGININQWAIDDIKLPQAWTITDYLIKDTVLVGIADAGVQAVNNDMEYKPIDLVDNVNMDLGIDLTSNVGNKSYLNPYDKHGTMIAGIIAAKRNNYHGIVGVCETASIVSLKLDLNRTDDQTNLLASDLCEILDYAAENNIFIINCSFGNSVFSYSMRTAISNFPGLVICSAGNNFVDTDFNKHYPSCYSCSNIISVGALNSDGLLFSNGDYGSNYGFVSVDIFAPGQNIISTDLDNSYYCSSGTSYAAPHVAGAAALLLSIASYYEEGTLTMSDIKNIILSSATQTSNLANKCVSKGKLNIEAAVKMIHTHNNSYEYEYYNDEYHKCKCSCSHFYLAEHEWTNISANANQLYAYKPVESLLMCVKCEVTKLANTLNEIISMEDL